MIAHVSIGVRDVGTSKSFYDAALEPLGYKCVRAAKSMVGYGYGAGSISFWIVSAERPVPADGKSGLHFCFAAQDATAVDAFHVAALRSGGKITVAPVCGRSTAPITTRPSSSTPTDTGLKHITAQARGEAVALPIGRAPFAACCRRLSPAA